MCRKRDEINPVPVPMLNRWLSRVPLLGPVAGCVAGILIAQAGWGWGWAAVLAIPMAVLAARRRWNAAAALAGIALFWWLHGSQLDLEARTAERAAAAGRNVVTIEGTLMALRDEEGFLPRGLLRLADGDNPDPGGGRVGVHGLPEAVRPGDRLRLRGCFEVPGPPRNPGQFDRLHWLRSRGIAAEFEASAVRVAGRPDPWLAAHRIAWEARLDIRRRLATGLDEHGTGAAVIRALVLGDRSGGDPEVFDAFRESGTMHLFAVSGLHVGLVGFMAWGVLHLFPVPRSRGLWMVLAAMWCYAMVTGLRPPALRASLMATALLAGFAVKRRPVLANSLLASMPAVLVMDSFQLRQAGFQLSYVVVATIILLAPFLYRRVEPWVRIDPFLPRPLLTTWQRRRHAARRQGAGLVVVSCAAWCGSLPLIALHFGMVTPVAVLASVALIPAAFAMLVLAFAGLALGSIWQPLGAAVNRVNDWLAVRTYETAREISKLPGSHFMCRRPDWTGGLVVFDLPHGDAAVYCGAGGGLLIDGGDERQFRFIVRRALHGTGTQIDSLALTHPDGGHAGGLTTALREFPVRQILLPVEDAGSPAFRRLRLEAARRGCREVQARPGARHPLDRGATLEVLRAAPDVRGGLADDRGMVLRLDWHGWRILLTGDAGFEIEKELLARGADLRSDVWIMGRHRTDFTGHLEFVEAVDPRIILADEEAFPPELRLPSWWVDALARRGIDLWRRPETGAVVLHASPRRLDLQSVLDPRRIRAIESVE